MCPACASTGVLALAGVVSMAGMARLLGNLRAVKDTETDHSQPAQREKSS